MKSSFMNKAAWAMLIVLSVLWGGSFFFVGVAVRDMPPLSIVVARVGIAALALHIVVLMSGQRMPGGWREWSLFLRMGFFNNALPFSLIVWGQTQIAGGLAAILNATTPLFTVAVAHALTKDERMSTTKVFGIFAGICGAALIIGPDALAGLGANVLAQLAVLGAALSYAFASVFGRQFGKMNLPPLAAATGQVTASTVLLLPLALIIEAPWTLPVPSMATLSALAGLGLVSTALAYILYFRILASSGATNVMLSTFLVPASAILLGALFLDETLEAKHFYGMALIGAGLAAIDGRVFKKMGIGRR